MDHRYAQKTEFIEQRSISIVTPTAVTDSEEVWD